MSSGAETAVGRSWFSACVSAWIGLSVLLATRIGPASEPLPFGELSVKYRNLIRPVLQRYCVSCHGGKSPKGDIDLGSVKSIVDIRRDPQVWQDMLFMLDNRQMPPRKSDQLSAHESRLLRSWIRQYLDAEAHANAGDPGRVVLRRLSHAEFENTVRDLTGVELRPTRQFPADSAAGEGFTNTGEALVLSPSLFEKYTAAARNIAAHAVLLPAGIRFSHSPYVRDWEQARFREIQRIYRMYADPAGLLSLEPYLVATLRLREQGGDRQVSIDQFARRSNLNPRYLRRIWETLSTPAPVSSQQPVEGRQSGLDAGAGPGYLMDRLRAKWRRATSKNYRPLVSWVDQWRDQMWSLDPLTISWYGRWQTARPVLLPRRTLRLKVQPSKGQSTIFLVSVPTHRAATAQVRWQNPRFEVAGKPPILLRDLLPRPDYTGEHQTDLVTSVPSRIELKFPVAQVSGREFVVDVALAENAPGSPLVHARIEERVAHWEDHAYPRTVKFKGVPRVITNAVHDRPAIQFEKNEHMMLGDSAQLRLEAFTITAVVKYDKDRGGPFRSIYNNYDNPINWGKGVSLQLTDSGVVYFFTTAGTAETYGQLFSSERLTPGFHIISVTYTPQHKKIYADGKLIGEGKSKGLDYGTGTKAAIGALREFGQDFEGEIAEVTVFAGVQPQHRIAFEGALGRKYDIAVTSEVSQKSQPGVNDQQVHPALRFRADQFVPAERYVPSLSPVSRPPLLGAPASQRFQEFGRQLREFRDVFPRGLCFNAITPLNPGQITLRVYYREDDPLCRLMLSDEQRLQLDRAWQELHYIGKDARREHHSFDVFLGFTTQVSKEQTAQFEQFREPIRKRAEAFEKKLIDSEPRHWLAVLDLANRAWRRPLTANERKSLEQLYDSLKRGGADHEEAIRLVLARLFVSPHFLYRIEQPLPGNRAGPVTNWELATRLSYLLWSSMPDEKLRAAAASGHFVAREQSDPVGQPEDPVGEQLVRHMHRMLQDQRVRGLATEFACQWLDLHDFASYDAKNERRYPTFAELRGDMYDEVVRFFEDLFRRNGSILEIIASDHTFVNEALAKHYGLSGIRGAAWQRVDGIRQRGRGGVISMAAVLSKQAGATRTSPVLRGNWIVETLLGEKLPDPPKTVPELPDAISREGLTVRESTEKHVSDPVCANCHMRIDPFGFALESFDAIGRWRDKDLLGKPVDTAVRLRDGTEFQSIDGLRRYLLEQRRDDFVRQFCRKLVGFALGRSVQLSDEPLLDRMVEQLAANGHRIATAVETVVRSRQFRYHRGLEATRPQEVGNR